MHSSLVWTVLQSDTAWPGVEGSVPLLCVIALAGVGTGSLFAVSLLAYWQRRSVRYLLVTTAVGALFWRTIVGFGTVLGVVPMPVHHLTEHSLDFLIAAVVLYALLRNSPTHLGGEPESSS